MQRERSANCGQDTILLQRGYNLHVDFPRYNIMVHGINRHVGLKNYVPYLPTRAGRSGLVVYARSTAEIVSSNPTWGMDVRLL